MLADTTKFNNFNTPSTESNKCVTHKKQKSKQFATFDVQSHGKMLVEDDLVIGLDEDGRADSPVIDLNLASNLLHVFSMTYTVSHTDDAKTYV